MSLTATAAPPPPPRRRRPRRRYANHGDGIGKIRAAGAVWEVVDVDDINTYVNIRHASRVIELHAGLGPGARAEVLAAAVETIHERNAEL